jgi:hypothetical protein
MLFCKGVIFGVIVTHEHRLTAFENRVLKKVFGTKRKEVTGEWRKFHNEELYPLYSLPDIIRLITSK